MNQLKFEHIHRDMEEEDRQQLVLETLVGLDMDLCVEIYYELQSWILQNNSRRWNDPHTSLLIPVLRDDVQIQYHFKPGEDPRIKSIGNGR